MTVGYLPKNLVDEVIIRQHNDLRGTFTKFFSSGTFEEPIKELFISETNEGFVRGIHLQIGKAASKRIVFNWRGDIHSVFLDLRPQSLTFGAFEEFRTIHGHPRCFLVPPGVAHGFQAISNCDVVYASSEDYNQELDTGVHPLSLEIKWPVEVRGLSKRDSELPTLFDFISQQNFHQ
jgi:dTDP-4-dehydrorhamnose 3,5-epimerase